MVEPTSLEHMLHCLILCLDVSVSVFAKTFRILSHLTIGDNFNELINGNSFNDYDTQILNKLLAGKRQLEHLDICLLIKLINLVINDPALRFSLNRVKNVRNELVHEFLFFRNFSDVENLTRKKSFLIRKLNYILKRTCDIAHLPIIDAEDWQNQLDGDIQFISNYRITNNNEMNQEEILDFLQKMQDVSIESNAIHENGSSLGLLIWISKCFCVALIQFVTYESDQYFQFLIEAGLFLFFKQKVFTKNGGTALSYFISLQEILISKILVSYVIEIYDYLRFSLFSFK